MTIARVLLDQLMALGIAVERLQNDSRHVVPGDVFLAYPGAVADGRDYLAAAIGRGAAAVLWDPAGFAAPTVWRVPQLAVPELKARSGELADLVYGQPSAKMPLIGVTGTNGKTSCSQWIAAALSSSGRRCAVLGTLGNGFPGALQASDNTTPDALALHRSLADYRQQGAQACAMEVSSIGLDQRRVAGVRFDTAVLTNLSRDHLDYHGTLAAYADAKRALFAWPGLRVAIANLDDPFGVEVLAATPAPVRIGYTLQGAAAGASQADRVLRADGIDFSAGHTRFTLVDEDAAVAVETALAGTYNVANVLAVAAVLRTQGLSLADVGRELGALQPPAGRMERIAVAGAPLTVVDYAHTPDALAAALTALRPQAEARGGRLVCVFGCGGDRDPGKRPLMGGIAQQLADAVWITSDNPRSESPDAIIDAIVAGLDAAGPAPKVTTDRAAAITAAIAAATPNDVLLIAGKGHEPYQEIAGVRHPFSDRRVVERALATYPTRCST